MEVARLFGVMPAELGKLPPSEYRKMVKYLRRQLGQRVAKGGYLVEGSDEPPVEPV